jgi:dTDP-4-amino-4,6-dideoxygalactose transaminase
MSLIIPPWPHYEQDELDSVQRVLASGRGNYWTGEEGKLFEQEFADWCGAKHGLCISNGTVALELALRACGIERGDEVIVTPRSFLASVAAVVAVGAVPVFADVEFDSGNISAETIEKVLTNKTKGIVPVHLGGWPADMPAIMELANKHGIKVIEDCAQAHGAAICGQLVGSFGHAAAFSFCQDKIMSTGGEGGMILTNDDEVRNIAWSLRDHGRNRERTLSNDHPFGFRWLQERFGTNGRMTEMQSAIGRCQLQKVDGWVKERTANAMVFTNFFSGIDGITVPKHPENIKHAYFRFTVLFDDPKRRDQVVKQLQLDGIPASVGPCAEIYRENAFKNVVLNIPRALSNAPSLGGRTMTLLVHPGLRAHTSEVCEAVTALFACI